MRLLGHFDKSGTFKAVDALKSLLKLQNMTHFNIGRKAKSTFENSSHVKVPSHLLNLKEIPMPMFMHGIRHMHKINKEQTSFWTFGNIALIVLFTVICVIIGIYMIKRYNKSSHSFCLKRTVGEHETAVTVLKLPTQDVRSNDIEESVPLNSVKVVVPLTRISHSLGRRTPCWHGQRLERQSQNKSVPGVFVRCVT